MMIKWSLIGCALLLCLMGLLSIQSLSYADDSKVVDLGEMSVHGEIRRPAITWIDSQKPVKDVLSSVVKKEFERFEAELLRPAVVESKAIVGSEP